MGGWLYFKVFFSPQLISFFFLVRGAFFLPNKNIEVGGKVLKSIEIEISEGHLIKSKLYKAHTSTVSTFIKRTEAN